MLPTEAIESVASFLLYFHIFFSMVLFSHAPNLGVDQGVFFTHDLIVLIVDLITQWNNNIIVFDFFFLTLINLSVPYVLKSSCWYLLQPLKKMIAIII